MEIIFANENDNRNILSDLIYNIDPYIYPFGLKIAKKSVKLF